MNENKNIKESKKKFHDSSKKKNYKPVNNKFTRDVNQEERRFKKNTEEKNFFGFQKNKDSESNFSKNRKFSRDFEDNSFGSKRNTFKKNDRRPKSNQFKTNGESESFSENRFKSNTRPNSGKKFSFRDRNQSEGGGDKERGRYWSKGANNRNPMSGNRFQPEREIQDDIGNRKPRFERQERDDIGNRKFENRKFQDKKFGDRKFGDKKFEDKKFGDRKFGDKKFEDRKFGDRKFDDKKFEDRKFGERKFDDKKFEDRKFGERKFGDKKFEDRKFGDRKFDDKKFEDRKFGDRKFGDNRFKEDRYEDRKFSRSRFEDRDFEEEEEAPELPPEKREVRRSKLDPSEWKQKSLPKTSKKLKVKKEKTETILEQTEEEKLELLSELREESFGGDARNFSDGEPEKIFRINRFLAKSGLGARRDVEALIKDGKIKVNGEVETSLSRKIDTEKDIVEYENEKVELISDKTILAFNKPEGYLCSHHDVHHEKTVFNLLPLKYRKFNMAGRLDLTSRGLMIFSADGETLNQISHPSYAIKKRYIVKLDKVIQESEFVAAFLKGVEDEGELLRAKEVSVIDSENAMISISLQEGKKRQIHRMFKAIGYKVLDLQRVQIGKLLLEDLNLPEGKFIEITREDIFG